MTNHDMVPTARILPHTNKVLHAPALNGSHNLVTDHSFKPTQLNHAIVKPVNLHEPVHNRFISLEEAALNKQIIGTHGAVIEDLNVRPVLAIAKDIIRLGNPLTVDDTTHATQVQAHLDTLNEKKVVSGSHIDEKTLHNHTNFNSSEHDMEIVKILAFPINKTSTEMICKCSSGAQAHAVTMDILKLLTSYSWDAKIAISFAAFTVNYGEFWLVENLYNKNKLAKSIAILKNIPETMGHNGELRKKFEAVLDLVNAVVKVTYCIVEFQELPSLYITRESPEMSSATAHIPMAAYWIIRSLLACTSTLLSLTGGDHEYMTATSESWEMLSLAHKLSVMSDHLQNQLMTCRGLIDRKKSEDAYTVFKKLMEQNHVDNMKVLKAMIRTKEEQKPLYDGSKMQNEHLEVFRLKYVLLLISDLHLPHEELRILHLIFNQQAIRHQYEVLWMPTLSPSENDLTLFYELRNKNMPWYSVDNPSLIEPVASRYIRDVWKFDHMPIVVVLDPQGKPCNLDALPVMWIWGSSAFPFTKIQEKALWADCTWNMELLADAIDLRIPEWIRINKVICLYGGEDIEWIRRFTLSAHSAAKSLNIPLEMLYVGKRNPKGKVQQCHEIINRENLSHTFSLIDYHDYIWYFWVRLWSMWNSKKQLINTIDVESDVIMQEITDVLTFDSSEQGWAVFSRGNYEMMKGKGDVVLPVLENVEKWAYKVDNPDKFVSVLDEEIRGVQTEHHCNRLILPGHAGYIPEHIVCTECGKTMDKFVMYRCCTE